MVPNAFATEVETATMHSSKQNNSLLLVTNNYVPHNRAFQGEDYEG